MPDCDGCTNGECGNATTVFSTTEKCPSCGQKLRLVGQMQTVKFWLECNKCGYHGEILSPEAVGDLL